MVAAIFLRLFGLFRAHVSIPGIYMDPAVRGARCSASRRRRLRSSLSSSEFAGKRRKDSGLVRGPFGVRLQRWGAFDAITSRLLDQAITGTGSGKKAYGRAEDDCNKDVLNVERLPERQGEL